MKKTLRIGRHEFIIDSRKIADNPGHIVGNSGRTTEDYAESTVPAHPWKSSSLHARVEEASRMREAGFNRFIPPPPPPDETPAARKAREKEEDRQRRELNRQYNAKITGRHLGGWVFYRNTRYAPAWTAWIFRTANREHSISHVRIPYPAEPFRLSRPYGHSGIMDPQRRAERQAAIDRWKGTHQ